MSIDIDEAKVERNVTGLWLSWALATALGLIIGYLPMALVVEEMDLGLARIIVPLFAGLLIGVAQWLVLRNYVTHSGDWVLHLATSWVVGYGLGLLIIDLLPNGVWVTILSFILFGVIVAVFQWPVLRREMPQLLPWLLANVVGWTLGAVLSMLVINTMFAESTPSLLLTTLVNMTVTGLVAGLITGLALVWIVRAPERAPMARSS